MLIDAPMYVRVYRGTLSPHRVHTQEVSEPRGYAPCHQAIIKPTRAMTVCLRIAGQPVRRTINAANQIYSATQRKINFQVCTEYAS